jgi:hypothetical protein
MDRRGTELARPLAFREVAMPARDSVAPAVAGCADFDCVGGFASLTSNVNNRLLSNGNQKFRDNSPEEPNSAGAPCGARFVTKDR